MELYEPPPSVWSMIELNAASNSELVEMKMIIGEHLVEQSQEFRQEVEALLEIWQDYRQEVNEGNGEKFSFDPPETRVRLRKEIKFFIGMLRDRATLEGRDDCNVFSHHNNDVIKYADGGAVCRPESGVSRSGRETPIRPRSSASIRSIDVSIEDRLSPLSVGKQLSISTIGEVSHKLRDLIEQEIAQLKLDITFLQECLEGEHDYGQEECGEKPDLLSLRQERSMLERELLMKSNTSNPALTVKTPLRPNTPKLKPLHRPGSSTSLTETTPSRGGPMKAKHPIGTNESQTSHTSLRDTNRPIGSSHRPCASQSRPAIGPRRPDNRNNPPAPAGDPCDLNVKVVSRQKLIKARIQNGRRSGVAESAGPCVNETSALAEIRVVTCQGNT